MFKLDKIMLTKNYAFVGKGYYKKGIFMLNVSKILNNKASSSSAYIVVSCDVWLGRLGPVNFSYIKKIFEFNLIPKLYLKTLENEKYV